MLNVLGQDESAPVMKHFLKRFPPGADRFEGVDTITATNGSPVLQSAIAHLECTVRPRAHTARTAHLFTLHALTSRTFPVVHGTAFGAALLAMGAAGPSRWRGGDLLQRPAWPVWRMVICMHARDVVLCNIMV